LSADGNLLSPGHVFYAGALVQSMKKEKGVLLDYSRNTLRTVEKYFLENYLRLKDSRDRGSLRRAVAAYLTEVTIRNFGGRASFDNKYEVFTVEEIGNLGVKATPELEVMRLCAYGKPGALEQYYDHVSLAVEMAKKGLALDQLKGEEEILRISSEAYVPLARVVSPKILEYRLVISTFYWCPVCNRAGYGGTYVTRFDVKRYLLCKAWLLFKSLKNIREKACSKCKGPVFPFGYVAGLLTHVLKSESGEGVGIVITERGSRSEEALVTGYSSVLGRSIVTAREIHRDKKREIVDIGEPETVSWILPRIFIPLSGALFWV